MTSHIGSVQEANLPVISALVVVLGCPELVLCYLGVRPGAQGTM